MVTVSSVVTLKVVDAKATVGVRQMLKIRN
jgi:hypothetical protein